MKLAKHLRLANDNSIYIREHRSIDRQGNKREKKREKAEGKQGLLYQLDPRTRNLLATYSR